MKLALVLLLCLVNVAWAKFAKGMIWGAATSAYQIEGAYDEDGKTPSVWDEWTHSGHAAGGETGDVADDSYHRYEEDAELLAALGVDEYRFSLSWNRILPNGVGAVNALGVAHYNRVIDALAKRNITVMVTLFHWDTPLVLEDRGGWLNADIASWFAEYADACFAAFGSRVKHWATFNEPHEITVQGYAQGSFPPGRCSNRSECSAGDSSTEPYIATHNLLRAHALAVKIYRERYQKTQGGSIGIVLNTDFYEPLDPSSLADAAACERTFEFQLGWFARPIFSTGQYPADLQRIVGSRLPRFTAEESKMLLGSADFLGLNHYTSVYCANGVEPGARPGWHTDKQSTCGPVRNGVPIGKRAQSSWLYVVPWGAGKMLQRVASMYPGVPLYITENGVDAPGESEMTPEQAVKDSFRIEYLRSYLESFENSTAELRGYFVWSLLDNFEWNSAYTSRFGIHYVCYSQQQKRLVKQSAEFYRKWIAAHRN